MKFISSVSITLRSGNGGKGIIAWRRESRVAWGGPDGGNGGNGGSIYIEADENVNSLFHIRHLRFLKAKDGEDGRNKSRHGKSEEDIFLKVPCGTNVFDSVSGEKIFELISHGEKKLICKGGSGGKGNAAFKCAQNPTPYLYEMGDLGEEKSIFLDLETISDVGLLGKPNAGKSSFLSVISNAKPKIASFPFTTLIPVLGTVFFKERKLVFADIPGLIENASEGAGLGIDFLKHLNRCKVLVHLVDISVENILEEIKSIEKEILAFSEDLYQKPRLLFLNKEDLISEDESLRIQKLIEDALNVKPIVISALQKKNIEKALETVFSLLEGTEEVKEQLDYLEIKDDLNLFAKLDITKEGDTWVVKHPSLEYWTRKIPRDTFDNIARLEKKIESLGVYKELEKAGFKEGDKLNIYDN